MRLLFYLLLIANVVFYLWSHTQRAQQRTNDEGIPKAPERLLLLSETASNRDAGIDPGGRAVPKREVPDVVAGAPRATVRVPATPGSSCRRIGPFAEMEEARRVLALVREWTDNPVLVTEPSETVDGYWLLYPRAGSIEEGRLNRKKLIEKGVKDVWLFEKGDMQGMISLGLYKTREEAEAERQRLAKIEVPIQVQPRISHAPVFWVQFDWIGPVVDLDEAMIQIRGENPAVSVPPVQSCPPISSGRMPH
ncbi:MAG TPA: hypothetical protein VNL74_10825 [Methylococcus sp.]|nr:hypothetical protein [Methylococcus sp.]